MPQIRDWGRQQLGRVLKTCYHGHLGLGDLTKDGSLSRGGGLSGSVRNSVWLEVVRVGLRMEGCGLRSMGDG